MPKKRKHQSIDEPKGPNAKLLHVAEQMKLSDLNEDVLIEIFSYLNAQEMVNVVKMDEVFLHTCRLAFQRNYKEKYIKLPMRESWANRKIDFIKNAELLRYFGENISKLEIAIDADNPIERRIYHLVVTKCRKTLTEITFLFPTTDLIINKCFTKLKTLSIGHGSVDQSMCRFRKWFPMLENLHIDCVDNIAKQMNMRSRIETLKCFSLDFSDENCELEYKLRIQDINEFIKCNPQLKEFRFTLDGFNIDTDTFIDTDTRLGDIFPEKLITVKLNVPFDAFHVIPDHSEALSELAISNHRVEHLEISTVRLTPQLCSYIDKCANLKSVKIDMMLEGIFRTDADPFMQDTWINLKNHELWTYLEISMNCFTFFHENYAKFGMSAIRPFLKPSKNVHTIKVRYVDIVTDDEHLYELALDIIRAQIDLKKWSFTRQILRGEISFTLVKL